MAALTVRTLETIKPATERREIPDQHMPGLYLIVQPSGAKSWAVRYRFASRTCKLTIGRYPPIDLVTARKLGAAALRTVAEGRDPGEAKRLAAATQGDTVAAVVQLFVDRHCRRHYRPRTLRDAQRYLTKYIIPAWGSRPVGNVTRRDVRELLEGIVEDSPVTANRLHSITRKLFGWAVEQDIIPASPVDGIKPPAEEKSRDRILTDQELRAVWNAAGQVDPIYGAMVRLLVLTGQRRGEIAGLMWSEIDLESRLISLPRARTKNDRAHQIPLSRQAMAVIKGLPHISEIYAFSVTGVGSINNFGKSKVRLDKLCGVENFTLHDLRRTCASGMARLGVNLPTIEKILNHVGGSFGGITGIYQRHDFAAEKRAALDAWGDHVATVIANQPVVNLRSKQ